MYANLGLHWAASVPAFLALLCVPMPFIFYKYGAKIRERCKYAREAQEFMRRMMQSGNDDDSEENEGEGESSTDEGKDEKDVSSSSRGDETDHEAIVDRAKEREEEREEEEQEAIDYSYRPEAEPQHPRLEPIKTTATAASKPDLYRSRKSYDNSPFDLDRTNTNTSFKYERRSNLSRRSSQTSRTSRTSRK